MNVLNRPLFRQAGGPAQPMPQDMAAPPMATSPMASEMIGPPPELAALEEAEAGAMAQGQELGAAYAQQMMQGIEGAQSTEDLINALRGDNKSLDARRSELAGFVGKADANNTPESVLAMVQPVIMMTEEGMMNSGIGALVQQITGDVEMTTASGAPTDMGMGLGSLMAAGAQEAPAPQNFRDGGEVAHLFMGSGPSLTAPGLTASESIMGFGDAVRGKYDDLLPLYQEILGIDDEGQKATKAQMLFDIARGGLDLAAGVPGAGSSFASQLAGAAAPVAENLQKTAAALDTERRGLKQAALGTAMQQALSDEDYTRKVNLAVLDASLRGTTTVDDKIVEMPDGTVKVFDLKTQLPAYRAAIESGGVVTEGKAGTVDDKIVKMPDGTTKVFNLTTDLAAYRAAIESGGVVTEGKEEGSYGSGTRGQALDRLSTPEGVQGAILGLLGERSREALLGLSDLAEIQEFSEQTGEATSVVPTHLQPFVRLINDPVALRTFQEENANTKQMFMKDMETMAAEIADGSKDPSELYDFIDSRIATAANIDMESGTGLPSGFWSLVEGSAQQFSDIFNLNIGDGLSDSDQARRMLSSVMQSVDRYVAGAPDESRLLQQQYERLVEQLPQASMFETDASAKGGLKNYRDLVDSDISVLKNTIEEAQLYRPGTLDKTRRRLMQAYNLRSLLNALYENYAGGASGANIPTDVDTFLKTSPSLQTPSFDMSKYYQRTGG